MTKSLGNTGRLALLFTLMALFVAASLSVALAQTAGPYGGTGTATPPGGGNLIINDQPPTVAGVSASAPLAPVSVAGVRANAPAVITAAPDTDQISVAGARTAAPAPAVLAQAGRAAQALPRTGTNLLGFVAIGLGLIALGFMVRPSGKRLTA